MWKQLLKIIRIDKFLDKIRNMFTLNFQCLVWICLAFFITNGYTQALNETICHYPSGATVTLSCPFAGNKVITLIESASIFYRYQNSLDDAQCIGSNTCCLGTQPYCYAIVNATFPDLFKSWQDKCDGRRQCSLDIFPVPLYDECSTACSVDKSCFSRELIIFFACFEAPETTTESSTTEITTVATSDVTSQTTSTEDVTSALWSTTTIDGKTEEESLPMGVIVFMVLCLLGLAAILVLLLFMMCRNRPRTENKIKEVKLPEVPRPVGPIVHLPSEDITRQIHGAHVISSEPRESVYVNTEYVEDHIAPSHAYVEENMATSNAYVEPIEVSRSNKDSNVDTKEKPFHVTRKAPGVPKQNGGIPTKEEHLYDALKRNGDIALPTVKKVPPKPKPKPAVKPKQTESVDYENVGFTRKNDFKSLANEMYELDEEDGAQTNKSDTRNSDVVFMENAYYETAGSRESKSVV